MATNPPVPDNVKFQGILVLADKIPEFTRELIDAIKKPTGTAVAKYKDLHTFVLELKDQCNGLYAMASAADKSLQTGKRKDKAREPKPAETEGVKYHTKSEMAKSEKKQIARRASCESHERRARDDGRFTGRSVMTRRNHPLYCTWLRMRHRCLSPSDKSWKDYGGRGIKICKRWGSFETFARDMGERPLGHTIERKNNNGNYTPRNCVWIPRSKQHSNTRQTCRIAHNGITQPRSYWARDLGITDGALIHRIKHWGLARALTTPPNPRCQAAGKASIQSQGSDSLTIRIWSKWKHTPRVRNGRPDGLHVR